MLTATSRSGCALRMGPGNDAGSSSCHGPLSVCLDRGRAPARRTRHGAVGHGEATALPGCRAEDALGAGAAERRCTHATTIGLKRRGFTLLLIGDHHEKMVGEPCSGVRVDTGQY